MYTIWPNICGNLAIRTHMWVFPNCCHKVRNHTVVKINFVWCSIKKNFSLELSGPDLSQHENAMCSM